jgi:hypothetical protein
LSLILLYKNIPQDILISNVNFIGIQILGGIDWVSLLPQSCFTERIFRLIVKNSLYCDR